MTINTTKDLWPDAKSDLAIEPPIASTQPGLGVPHASSEPDLESRIKMKHRLEHWLAESKGQLPTQGGPARTGQS